MKKLLFILIVISLSAPALPAPADNLGWFHLPGGRRGAETAVNYRERRGEEISVTVRFPGFSAAEIEVDGQLFQIISVRGCGSKGEIGQPELPFKGIFLEVPAGVEVELEIGDSKPVSLGKNFRVYPRQPPEPDDSSGEKEFVIDEEFYRREGFSPPYPVRLSSPGFIRGRRVVFAEISPLQHNPSTGEIRGFPEVHFKLVFRGSVDIRGEVRKSRLFSPSFEALTRNLILNWTATEPALAKRIPTSGWGEYLIITADDFYDEIADLAEWKFKKGYSARVAKFSEIGNDAGDIQEYLQDVYDTWSPAPSFVLLVGDHDQLPCQLIPPSDFPSDLPYSCLDGDDYYPDVTLGRISVNTAEECAAVVDKILAYDREPPSGTWYSNALIAAYFQDSTDNGIADRWFLETAVRVMEFLRDEVGLNPLTAFCTTHWPLTHDVYYYRTSSYPHRPDHPETVPEGIVDLWTVDTAATAAVSDAINSGVGLVQHRDHGGVTGWGDPPYFVEEVEELLNGEMTPVVFSINCLTGALDYPGGDCFAEALQKKSPGGAVGIVAATRSSYSGYNDLFSHGIYTCFFPDYDSTYTDDTYPNSLRPNEAMNFGKYYMMYFEGDDELTEYQFQLFHWFGDPEIGLRTRDPDTLDVTHPGTIYAGESSDLTVSVEVDGSPLSGALICLSIEERPEEYETGTTDGSGEVTFPGFTPANAGEYDLVVTADNAAPYEGTITAAASSNGVITLDAEFYTCSEIITVTLSDAGLAGFGTQTVSAYSDSEPAPGEEMILAEGGLAGVFSGNIPTSSSTGAGVLTVAHGDAITAHYYDADTGGGLPGDKYATAQADCQGPAVQSVTLGDGNGVITVTLSEDAISTGLSADDINPTTTGDKLGSDPVVTPARCTQTVVFTIATTASDARQFSSSDVFNFQGAEDKITDIHGSSLMTVPGSPTMTLTDVTPPDFSSAHRGGDYQITVFFDEPVDMSTADFSDFTVGGHTPYQVEAFGIAGLTLYVEERLGPDETPLVGMSAAGAIDDLSGNELNAGNGTPVTATSADYYVSANLGSDYSGDGSPAHPWRTIAYAAYMAEGSAAAPVRIAVAEGAYDDAVYLDEWESVYGGFGETTWERDIAANPSVIDVEGDTLAFSGADNSEISGFTIRNAKYGIYCFSGGPEIRDNLIESCTRGIYWGDDSSGIIELNTIRGSYESGLYIMDGSPTVSGNLIMDTLENGLYVSSDRGVLISNNLIGGSGEDGIRVSYGEPATVVNCTIVGSGDDGIEGSAASVTNCVLWNNADYDLRLCSASYSCVEDGDAGEGNISSDPQFSSLTDFRLQSSSPCIDTGTDAGGWYGDADLDGDDRIAFGAAEVRVDMGAYEYNPLAGVASFRTLDQDGDHRVDHIRVALSDNLNDDFTALTMAVEGYSLDPTTPNVTGLGGGGTGDNIFYAVLQEGAEADTGSTPISSITANTSLRDSGSELISTGSGRAADGVSPALLGTTLGDGDGIFTLLFSEDVSSLNLQSGDINPAATRQKLGSSPLVGEADEEESLLVGVAPSATDAVQFGTADVFNLSGAEVKLRDGNDNTLASDTDLPPVTLTDVTAPDFQSAFKLDAASILLNFSEPLDSSTVSAADFSVFTNTVLDSALFASNRVELILQDPMGEEDYPVIAIAPGGSIDDLSGNELTDANDTPVTAQASPSDGYYYVSADYGTDAESSGGPFQPFRTISYALQSISGTPVNPLTVLVAAGTYRENVVLDSYEILRGGYDPVGWSRDWSEHTATIDGGCSGDTVVAADSSTLDGFVVTSAGDVGVLCTSSGFTLSNNLITGNAAAGVYCSSAADFSVLSNVIEENGDYGIYCYYSSPDISGNTISGNANDGIYCYHGSDPEISGNEISGNRDHGIYCNDSAPLVSGNQILDNDGYAVYCSTGGGATVTGNTIAGNEDGIYCSTASEVAEINRNIIRDNNDDGIIVYADSPPPVINNLVLDNGGDGLYISSGSSVLVRNNTVCGNADDGIDASTLYAAPAIRNCIFWGNGDDLEDCQATFSCIEDGDAGRGNISSDPLFVDPAGGDYHLQSTEGSWHGGAWLNDTDSSPCLNQGLHTDDYSQEPAPNGGRINQGAYGNTEEASKWSQEYPTPVPTASPSPSPTASATPSASATATLVPTATPTPTPFYYIVDSGDYDGDGTSDIAIYRGAHGLWSARDITRVYFGSATDRPSSGDFDGDGTTDVSIFRGSYGLWAVRGVTRIYFGSATDMPVPGDYDEDGTTDVGIFRGSYGLWAVRGISRVYFGMSGDLPVPGYYDVVGGKEIGLYRGSSGLWAIRNVTRVYFGSDTDYVVPGDYDGDGVWECGIFRPSSGLWAIRRLTRVYFGGLTDQTVPADYDGDFRDDVGVFREGSGLWAVRGMTRVYYGSSGDLPVTR